jgi:hypothetical protein
MFFFVSRVVGAVILIIGIAWFIQRKRHPERFRDSWRHAAMPGSPVHWRNHRH